MAKKNVAMGYRGSAGWRAATPPKKKNASVHRRKQSPFFRAKGKKNVAAGFYDEDGYFHPIRASYDYDSRRAGEGRKKKNPTKAQKRAKVRKASVSQRVATALAKFLKQNPRKAKGKSVRLTNFTGTVTKLRTGQVKIQGRKRTIRKRK